MTQAQSVITDEMRAAIGVEGDPVTLEVEKTNCRMFARAVGHSDLIFYDEETARARGYRGIVAPPGFLGTVIYRPGRGSTFGEGGAGRGFTIPYKRVLNGGTDYEYDDAACAGDVLEARTKVVDISERTGSIGPMLIVRRQTTYTRVSDGKVVARMFGASIHY